VQTMVFPTSLIPFKSECKLMISPDFSLIATKSRRLPACHLQAHYYPICLLLAVAPVIDKELVHKLSPGADPLIEG
jgi:hypothetical protein